MIRRMAIQRGGEQSKGSYSCCRSCCRSRFALLDRGLGGREDRDDADRRAWRGLGGSSLCSGGGSSMYQFEAGPGGNLSKPEHFSNHT